MTYLLMDLILPIIFLQVEISTIIKMALIMVKHNNFHLDLRFLNTIIFNIIMYLDLKISHQKI